MQGRTYRFQPKAKLKFVKDGDFLGRAVKEERKHGFVLKGIIRNHECSKVKGVYLCLSKE